MSKHFILIEIEQLPLGAPEPDELKVALEHLMLAFGAMATIDNLSEDELEDRFTPGGLKVNQSVEGVVEHFPHAKDFDWEDTGNEDEDDEEE